MARHTRLFSFLALVILLSAHHVRAGFGVGAGVLNQAAFAKGASEAAGYNQLKGLLAEQNAFKASQVRSSPPILLPRFLPPSSLSQEAASTQKAAASSRAKTEAEQAAYLKQQGDVAQRQHVEQELRP